ncbi:MAG: hypothetical protein RSE18_00230 [Acinetobacter sp.]
MNHAEIAPSIDEKLEKIDQLFEELSLDIQQLDHSKVEEMIAKYILVRNKLTLGRKSFETFETSAKAIQDVLNATLVQIGNETGVESFKTASGTAFRKIKKAYRVEDWDAYSAWLLETGNMHCVEKRPAKMAVEEIHTENGEVPPGLRFEQEIEYQFRKA